MKFGRWAPLAEAAALAPEKPGVLQIRVSEGVLDYPRGKSAMVHYQAAASLRGAIERLADRWRGRDFLCRTVVQSDNGAARELVAELSAQFRRRFGDEPRLPEADEAR